MQIRGRLTLQFILVVTLILLTAFGVIYYSSAIYRRYELYQRLENKARTTAEIFVSIKQIDSTMLKLFQRTEKDKLPFENISIYDERYRELYANNDTLNFQVGRDLLDEVWRKDRTEFVQEDFEILGITYAYKANRFIVFAGAIDIFGKSKLANLRRTLLILFILMVSVVALTGWIYAGRALRPLSQVINEVEAMKIDRLDERLNSSRYSDEIGRLIATFNTLLDRIENSFTLQKLFLSGASHELRNPLTSITSQLQVALLKERSTSEYRQLIGSILEDIKQLNSTTIDLLEFARLSYEKDVVLSDTRIDDVLWHCSEYFRRTYQDYKVNIRFEDLPEDPVRLIVRGNEALLRIAFINLIDNACKFSPNKRCDISLTPDNEKLSVVFADSGIGMHEDQVKLIFEPFYRGNSTAEVKGHGIGLALTMRIVQLHNAKLSVVTSPGKGAVFTFTLFKN